jgi:hypothetical protein
MYSWLIMIIGASFKKELMQWGSLHMKRNISEEGLIRPKEDVV